MCAWRYLSLCPPFYAAQQYRVNISAAYRSYMSAVLSLSLLLDKLLFFSLCSTPAAIDQTKTTAPALLHTIDLLLPDLRPVRGSRRDSFYLSRRYQRGRMREGQLSAQQTLKVLIEWHAHDVLTDDLRDQNNKTKNTRRKSRDPHMRMTDGLPNRKKNDHFFLSRLTHKCRFGIRIALQHWVPYGELGNC